MRARLFFTIVTCAAVLCLPGVVFALTAECPSGINCNANLDLNKLIMSIINVLLSIALVVDILFIIIGGFFYIISGGNEERMEKGKDTVTNAIVGLIIIVMSYTIAYAVSNYFLTA